MFIYFHFKKGFIFCLLIIIFHLFSRIIESSNLIIEDNFTILKRVSQISVIFVFIIEKQYTKKFIQNTESPNYDNFKEYLFPQDTEHVFGYRCLSYTCISFPQTGQ